MSTPARAARSVAARRRRGEEGVERLRAIRDPWERVGVATALLTAVQEEARAVALLRDETITQLRLAGNSYGDIAKATGLTRARIAQIVREGEAGR